MTAISTPRPDIAFGHNLPTTSVSIVASEPGGQPRSYRATHSKADTAKVLKSISVPADPSGQPPQLTAGEIVEVIGGYRAASVCVEVEARRLAKVSKRVAENTRRWHRRWLQRVPSSVLLDHGITPYSNRRRLS